ncbi:unnamed protein product [Acanthoscelides obtectus]
MFPY